MSHLLKQNKKILFFIKFIFVCIFFGVTFKAIYQYTGNKFLYAVFSILSLYLIFFSFRKKSLFYENFLGVFLFLGFWFKFSIILGFKLGYGEGIDSRVLISPDNFDDTLLVSITGILAFVVYGYLRQIYIFYPSKIILNNSLKLYDDNRNLIIAIFICFILSVCLANINFKIYQRGLIGENYNFLISGFIKTCLLYFLSFCSGIIIYFDLLKFKKIFTILIFIFIFESFISSISMLSRGMIFNSSALLFALYKFTNKSNINFGLPLFLKVFITLVIAFLISVYSVNYLRIHYHGIGAPPVNQKTIINNSNKVLDNVEIKEENFLEKTTKNEPLIDEDLALNEKITKHHKKQTNFLIYNNSILNLIIYRWVGIEAVLIVTRDKSLLNFELFKQALKEKFHPNLPSFYERTFKLKSPDNNNDSNNSKGNTLPGFIAFLFFSGSYLFLFSSVFFMCFIASIFEYLFFKILDKNMFASSVIAMTIVYRFVHFGYLPRQSYLLFGSIIGLIIALICFKTLYKKFNLKYNNQ